jgi:RNA polymerase sigma factor (sigma-70 family)
MAQIDDIKLLEEFAATRDEAIFTDIVQRHIALVYSTALRRTANPHAAEEVAQAVFILLARKAGSLPSSTILSGWLYQTARLTASNYLRAEIRRQQREREACMDSLVNEQEPDVWPQIAPLLDDAMARLGEIDRNAIVLRYFENKRLAEVGAALGTSEDAARVRVNRALEKLRQIFASRGVMLGATLIAGAVSANSVQAAPLGLAVAISSTAAKVTTSAVGLGLGTKLASALGKSVLFSWFVPLISVIGILPGLVFAGFMGRMERKNFRDPQGFRPRLHWLYYRSFLWGFPLVCILMMAIIHYTHAAWGATVGKGLLAGFGIYVVLIGARSLIINRGPFQIGMFAYSLIIVVGLFTQALGWMPHSLGLLPIILASVVLLLVFRKRPMRMDYSLFLRAAQGLLQTSESTGKAPLPGILSRASLLEFGRLLGSRYLANNFRWEFAGLALRLPPVRNRFLMNMAIVFMQPISPNCSHILLGWDGTVVAHCGKSDTVDLVEMHSRRLDESQDIELTVETSVSQAWYEFRRGNLAAAERSLGEMPESQVFLVAPGRAKAVSIYKGIN